MIKQQNEHGPVLMGVAMGIEKDALKSHVGDIWLEKVASMVHQYGP